MRILVYLLVIVFIFFSFCGRVESSNSDTLEFLNRRVYSFNRGFDKSFMNPVLDRYINCGPIFFDNFLRNFFNNVSELQCLLFSFLMCDLVKLNMCINRFFLNSYFGLFGLVDVTSYYNVHHTLTDLHFFLLKKNKNKINYMMLPLVGPGTMFFNISILVSHILNPFFYFSDKLLFYYFLEVLSKKSFIFFDSSFFHDRMADGYLFLKDVYIQNLEKLYISECDVFLCEQID